MAARTDPRRGPGGRHESHGIAWDYTTPMRLPGWTPEPPNWHTFKSLGEILGELMAGWEAA